MFDFASRPGLNCSIPSNATYISGNLSKMRMWRSTPNITLPYKLIGDEGRETVSLCFRHYLGFCEESYCQNQDTQSDILVAHLRQGDLFPPNFKRSYHEPMWSLPMTAYLSVFTHRKWRKIFLSSEPTSDQESPVQTMLKYFNSSGLLPLTLLSYQTNRTLLQDIQTMICSSAFLASHSSLALELIPLGFSELVYSYKCPGRRKDGRQYYQFVLHRHKQFDFFNHSNSPNEWVSLLLYPLPKLSPCV